MSRRMIDFDSTNEKPTAADEEFEQYVKKLESLVRAADMLREATRNNWSSDYYETQMDGELESAEMNYDTQRAAVGEIEGD